MSIDVPDSILRLTERYDAFVFDVWGVLHNGVTLYPAVLPLLRDLRASGKKIGILSNSPRPLVEAAKNLATKFGLTPDFYDTLLTSGQLAYELLRDRPDPWSQKLGTRCLPVGPEHETSVYFALGLERATDAASADFVLVTGLAAGMDRIEDYHTGLQAWRQAELPLLCANPDRNVMRNGEFIIAGGAIAAAYQELGGDMRDDCGKPHPAVFRRMLAALQVPAAAALMIGDNLHTDIKGAQSLGMGTLWITGGVHAPELEVQAVETPEHHADFASYFGLQPDHLLPRVG